MSYLQTLVFRISIKNGCLQLITVNINSCKTAKAVGWAAPALVAAADYSVWIMIT